MDNKLYKTAFILILIPSIACLIGIIMRISFGGIEGLGDTPKDALVSFVFSITGYISLLGIMSAALGLVLAIIAKIVYKVKIKFALIMGCAFFVVFPPYAWLL